MVIVVIARGHDASYPFKTIGAAVGATITGERGAGCCLSAVEKGGEPAGIWVGNGAAELGFRDGDVVRREDFEPLFARFLDSRDRFEDAHEIPVAIFPQHTSRNGDPHLHVHVLRLNKVQTVRDGQCRAIDSRGLYREKGAGSALAACARNRAGPPIRVRVGIPARAKGKVIAGFPEQVIAQFSFLRARITKTAVALAEEYQCQRGHVPNQGVHVPNQRASASIRQVANTRTRKGKEAGPLDFAQLPHQPEHLSRDAVLRTLRDLAHHICAAQPARTAKHAQTADHAQTPGQNSTGWPRGLRHGGNSRGRKNARDGRRPRTGAGDPRRMPWRRSQPRDPFAGGSP